MKKKKECAYCKTHYDGLYDKCPNCGEPNPDKDSETTKNLSVYPLYKQILFFAVGLIGFQIAGFIISIILYLAYGEDGLNAGVLNFCCYALTFAGLICVSIPKFDELFKSFKTFKPFGMGLAGFGALIAFSTFYSLFLAAVGYDGGENINETSLVEIIKVYPVLSFVIFGVVGPICEELTYRVGLYTLARRLNRVAAYFITVIVFALIHFNIPNPFDINVFINELINLPHYLFAGFVMTYLYDRYGLASSLTAHVTNNLYSIIMSLVGESLNV